VIYGIRLLEILRDLDIPAHLVMSRSAEAAPDRCVSVP
jgi:4-hydroxy-3-polyprenylbenzoate decarboxylase